MVTVTPPLLSLKMVQLVRKVILVQQVRKVIPVRKVLTVKTLKQVLLTTVMVHTVTIVDGNGQTTSTVVKDGKMRKHLLQTTVMVHIH